MEKLYQYYDSNYVGSEIPIIIIKIDIVFVAINCTAKEKKSLFFHECILVHASIIISNLR